MNASRLFGRGLAPAMPDLPPSLQPHAIQSAAPPRSRRLSFLASCLVYTCVAAGFTVASRLNPEFLRPQLKTVTVSFQDREVKADPGLVTPPPVAARPPMPPPEIRGQVDTTPILPTDVVPQETPTSIPTVNNAWRGAVPGDSGDPSRQVAGGQYTGPQSGGGGGGGGQAPTLVEVDYTSMKVLHQVAPLYPPLCRIAKIQGTVELLMTVDLRGVPVDVQLLSSPNASLSVAAGEAARQWRFAPALVNGQPCSSRFRLTIKFALTR